jgi:hypothetical protein
MWGGKSFYLPISLVYLCAIIGYSLTLIFSNTRKRPWVKLAGICGLLIGLVLLSAYIGSINPKNVHINNILEKIVPWSQMIGALINVFFIMNFLDEIRALKAENTHTSGPESLENLFLFAAIVAFAFSMAFGAPLFNQSFGLFWGRNHDSDLAQQMVKLAGGAKIFVDGKGDSLRYILIKPQGYDPQKKYPLVVSLPYGRYEAGAAQVLSDAYRGAYPAFIFVPYIPEHQSWGGVPGLPSLDTLIYETISALPEPGIDVKRRYVTGVSFGAYGTWHFICSHPDMFAAAIPVSGAGDPKLASKIVNMPIWAFHGAKDRNVPVSGSRDMIAAIKKAGGHPKYTEYPDDGHGIWGQVSETPGLWNWLFAQKQK